MKFSKKIILIIIILLCIIISIVMISHKPQPYFIQNYQKITLEIAKTPQQRERGLMYRKFMPENHGMLFIFNKPQHLSFWMKNTLIPLDMIFLNQHKVVAILQNVPPCSKENTYCPSYSPDVLADAVIELNAGMIENLKITVGIELIPV